MNISKLKADVEKLRASVKRLGTKLEAERAELRKLEIALIDAEHKASIEKLVGVERGVIIGLASNPKLRGKRATVVKVNRTRASVLIDGEDWDFPLRLLRVDPVQAEVEFAVNGCRVEVEE